MSFFFGLCGPLSLSSSRPEDEYIVSRLSFSQLVEIIHADFHGLPSSRAIVFSLVMSRMPGNLSKPGSGLLSQWVRHVSLLLPALVYHLSYLSAQRRLPGNQDASCWPATAEFFLCYLLRQNCDAQLQISSTFKSCSGERCETHDGYKTAHMSPSRLNCVA